MENLPRAHNEGVETEVKAAKMRRKRHLTKIKEERMNKNEEE